MQTAALPATNPVSPPARNVSRTSPSPSISSLDTPDSTWISRVVFIRAANDRRFLAFYVRDTDSARDRVLLYSDGPRRKLPLALRDIFTGTLAAHCSLSIGQAYNRLVRGNPAYRYQSVGRAELDAVLATI